MMMRMTGTACVLLALVVFACACGGRKPHQARREGGVPSPLEPFTKVTFDNGLDVIVKEVHTAPIVAVYLWCNTGSINERDREQGISHFYEHMFFKGTEKRGVGEIDLEIKRLGGYNNAFTSKEYTAYYVVLPSENFTLAADVLLDAIRNSLFPEDEIAKELGVISEEINRKEDNPTGTLYEKLFELMFPGTPYAHPVLGTKETVSALTRDDFKDYLSRFYIPNNMTAVVVGDVDTDTALAELRRLTKDWKPDPTVADRLADVSVPRREGVRGFTLEKDVNMAYAMLAFQTDGRINLDETMALDVASSVLGEGRSSRLYRRLVEGEQLVSSVSCYIYPMLHTGLFMVVATLDPANIDAFKAAVLEEVGRLGTEPLPPDELAKVKTMLTADFAFSNETNSNIAHSLGFYHTIELLDTYTNYESLVADVEVDDVIRHAKRVLDPASHTVGVIVPRGRGGEGGTQ